MAFQLLIKKYNSEMDISISGNTKIRGTTLLGSIYREDKISPHIFNIGGEGGLLFSRSKKIHILFHNIRSTLKNVGRGKFLELFIFGLSFNCKKIYNRNCIEIEFHMSKKLRFYIPKFVFIKVYKRRLFFFSMVPSILERIENFFTALRPVNSYTGYGVRKRGMRIKIKKGKTR